MVCFHYITSNNQCDFSGLITKSQYYETVELSAHSSTAPTGTNIQDQKLVNCTDVMESHHPVRDISHGDSAEIKDFLHRRVLLEQFDWDHDSDLNVVVDPWQTMFDNPVIINKLRNYGLFQGDLKITIYVNGTPFHCGMALASYNYRAIENSLPTPGGTIQLINRSQRPCTYLNVSSDKSGEFIVPFYYPFGYLKTHVPFPGVESIGKVFIDGFFPLRQLNSGTEKVTFSVFGEFVNVKLGAPTMALYAVSDSTPVDFSRFDHVESKGTRNRQGDQKVFKNHVVPNMANVGSYDTSQTLTFSPSTATTPDLTSTGIHSRDECSIKYLSEKQSFVDQFAWFPVTPSGTYIFAGSLDPMWERRFAAIDQSATVGTVYAPTALSFVSRPFSEWTGALKIRFQIATSQYHRGRLAVVYDPLGPPNTSTTPFNSNFTTIIDLSEGRDFTIEFPWQQDRPYKILDHFTIGRAFEEDQLGSVESYVPDPRYTNGAFYVYVVNQLVSPDSTTPVNVIMSISAGESFELMNPGGRGINVSPFPPKNVSGGGFAASPDMSGVSRSTTVLDSAASSLSKMKNAVKRKKKKDKSDNEVDPNPLEALSNIQLSPHSSIVIDSTENEESSTSLLDISENAIGTITTKWEHFYGERITSIYDLMKRFCYYRTLHDEETDTQRGRITYVMTSMPCIGGFDAQGPDQVAAFPPIAYAQLTTTYMAYFKGAYTGWRGSTRWKFMNQGDSTSLSVCRLTGSDRDLPMDFRPFTRVILDKAEGPGRLAQLAAISRDRTGAGMATSQTRTMDALEVEIPYTIPQFFCGTVPQSYVQPVLNDGGDRFLLMVDTGANPADIFVDSYCACGDDFRFFAFNGAPVFYTYTNDPDVSN
jgi:hypothetical protein